MENRHDTVLMRDDFSDEDLHAGRALLANIMRMAEVVGPEVPVDPGLPTEERKMRTWTRRSNLDALLLHRLQGKWRAHLLLKYPAMCIPLDASDQKPGPLRDRQEAMKLAVDKIYAIVSATAQETPAQRAVRAADGTFHIRHRHSGRRTDTHRTYEKENSMGLDYGFYNQNEDALLAFRNHHRLLDLLSAEPHVTVEPYDDFYVTSPMVAALLGKIEAEMKANGQPLKPIDARRPKSRRKFIDGIPTHFCDREPESWIDALPHYRVLLTRLLALVRHEGVLICGWSA